MSGRAPRQALTSTAVVAKGSWRIGLYESLLGAVSVSAGWVEYGLLEYRFSQARPEGVHELVKTYGHTNLGPKRYTASNLLDGCLGRFSSSRRQLLYRTAPSTGYWSYNNPGSYYAMPTGPESTDPTSSETETYAAFCISNEQDLNSFAWWPAAWPQTGSRTGPPSSGRAVQVNWSVDPWTCSYLPLSPGQGDD